MSAPSSHRLNPLCERIARTQIDAVIHAFYIKLRAHPELKTFFAHIDDFAPHERHIADFWWLAMGGKLLGDARPQFDMIRRHRPLGITPAALQTWLAVFNDTLNENLAPDVAAQWQQMAVGIAGNLQRMLFGGGAVNSLLPVDYKE